MNIVRKYRKRPVVIEAMRWDGSMEGGGVVLEWIAGCGGDADFGYVPHPEQEVEPEAPAMMLVLDITTLEGVVTANPGDFVIKGVQGEFYPCKPDIFDETYEKEEGDERVGDVITTWEQLMQLPSDSLLMTESGYHVLWNAELKTITFSDASHSRLRTSEGLPNSYRNLTVLHIPEVGS